MKKTITAVDLKNTIQQLEYKQTNDWLLLKRQFHNTFESLKPANLIKHTVHELSTSPDFKKDILNATFSVTAGYISKKIAVGATRNPLKELLGTILQVGVTSVVSKNTQPIKSAAAKLINTVFAKKSTPA